MKSSLKVDFICIEQQSHKAHHIKILLVWTLWLDLRYCSNFWIVSDRLLVSLWLFDPRIADHSTLGGCRDRVEGRCSALLYTPHRLLRLRLGKGDRKTTVWIPCMDSWLIKQPTSKSCDEWRNGIVLLRLGASWSWWRSLVLISAISMQGAYQGSVSNSRATPDNAPPQYPSNFWCRTIPWRHIGTPMRYGFNHLEQSFVVSCTHFLSPTSHGIILKVWSQHLSTNDNLVFSTNILRTALVSGVFVHVDGWSPLFLLDTDHLVWLWRTTTFFQCYQHIIN